MPGSSPDSGLLANKRVLVVEDEFLIALDIERIIESAGARDFVVVNRCSDALKAIAAAPFDLAVLDFKLDKENVLPVAEELIAVGTPFIFLTGASSESMMAQKQFENIPGAAKPFDSATLLAALSKAIKKS